MNAAMPDLRILYFGKSMCRTCWQASGIRMHQKPENEDEEKALNEMDTCLAGKNPVVVPLLTECASYISNLLNDVYIEEKMCSLFPGSIKKGILINRRRNVEWIPPLKELLEGNSDPVSVFFKGTCTVCPPGICQFLEYGKL